MPVPAAPRGAVFARHENRVPHVSPFLRDMGATLQLSVRVLKPDMTHFIPFTRRKCKRFVKLFIFLVIA
jgi:hypothetical protein